MTQWLGLSKTMLKGLVLQALASILGYVMGLSLQKADFEMEIGVQEAS